MAVRVFRGLVLVAALLALFGCYHLRLDAVPLQAPRFAVARPAEAVFREAKALIQQAGYVIEQEDGKARTLLTDYRHFSTHAGITQPAGGRLYYHRLRLSIGGGDEAAEVTLESVDLEIRSSYVYDEEGKVLSFRKRYPYDHYPGMFDLSSVNRELGRMKGYLETALRDGGKHGR